MVRRRVSRDSGPDAAWNAFVDLIATEEYADLDPVQKVAHLAFWYDSEVQNGGHLQYFQNRGTGLVPETLEALKVLGAHCQLGILARAAAVYDRKPRKNVENVDEYVDEALEGEFEEFDDKYYACQPEIADLLERYFEQYRASFVEEV